MKPILVLALCSIACAPVQAQTVKPVCTDVTTLKVTVCVSPLATPTPTPTPSPKPPPTPTPTPSPTPTPAPSASPTTLPLLQATSLTYAGAIRVPAGAFGNTPSDEAGTSFGWAGAYGLAFNAAGNGGAGSLFLSSKENLLNVAEITIPAPLTGDIPSLPVAAVLQGMADPSEGRFAPLGVNRIGGLLVANGKLIFDGYIYYDANNTQVQSHFSRSTSLTTPSVQGPYAGSGGSAGFLDGYMGSIPAAWQPLLGGTALTGNGAIPIVSRTSNGPGVFAFSPETLGANFAAQPLVYYPLAHPTLGMGTPTASGALFNLADSIHGVVFPEGTRSVLFFGLHGQGAWCYGEGTDNLALVGTFPPDDTLNPYCYDPTNFSHGQHAYPLGAFVWAYDANDFLAVKAGTKQPWEVLPYATWTLPLPYPGTNEIGGVAYDPKAKRIYVLEKGRQQIGCCTFLPVIHVFNLPS